MRKKIGLGILFSAVVILIFSVFADSFSGRFDTITADPDTIASVKSMRAGASNPDFDIFFNDQKLLFDASLNTFFYSVPQNDKYAYNPRVHISASEDLQILFDDSGITPKSIEQNIPVSVIVYSDSEYWESSLVCTTLPIINIGCDNDIGMDYSPMSFYLYDNNCGQFSSSIESDGLIHLRGHSALNYPKRAYRIKLTTESLGNHQRANDVSLLSMRQDDDWLLYAAYNDQEKIRNVFSQNLWKNSCSSDNQYHVETGCEYKYVELFINSEYNGLYALGYPIDEKLLNFNGDLAKNALFKKVDYSNEQSFYINENNELTGYELKTSDGNIDSISLVPGSGSSWSLLTDYYFALSEHAGDTDFLYKGIDLDNAIDNYLFLNLIQGMDNIWGAYINNQYLALSKNNGTISCLYCPWDMDITWGNEWVEDTDNYTIPYNIPVYFNEVMENGYLNQIIINNDSDIWTKIFSKYEYLRNTSWSEESIMQQLSEYEAQIYDSGAYLRDMSRWPDGTYQNPELKLSEFKKYVHNRIVFTDGYMKHLKEFCNKTTLLRRTAYYEHFTESDFVIEINDHSLLNLPEYIDLFDYMGINISDISDNVRYIVGSPHNGYDYLNELCSPGTGIDTKAGYIEIKPSKYADASSGDLTLFIDDVPCCELWTDITPKARITFTYGGRGYYELNLAGDFTYKINQ